MMNIILPPGSTSVDLQAAINSAGSGDVIELSSDMPFSSTVTIPSGLTITIQSNAGNNWVMTQTATERHFLVNGELTLQNIILDGGGTSGGIHANAGTLVMNDGAVITKCSVNLSGSGVYLENGSTFTMYGGEISDNHQSTTYGGSGGGVCLTGDNNYTNGSTFTMYGGKIINNSAVWGGGVGVGIECIFTMTGGEISGNSATLEGGGGVHVYVHGTFTMTGGTISNNTATGAGTALGGGVFVGQGTHIGGEPKDWCKFIMTGGTISNNDARVGGGGVAAEWNGQIEMSGGSIFSNTGYGGGGILLANASEGASSVSLTMLSGEIYGNKATENATSALFGGGGITVIDNNTSSSSNSISIVIGDSSGSYAAPLIYDNFSGSNTTPTNGWGGGIYLRGVKIDATIYDARIYKNTAAYGGGICVHRDTTLKVYGGIIGSETADEGNVAYYNGGGAYVTSTGSLTVTSGTKVTSFTGNSAANAGGGIYTEDYSYANPADSSTYANISISDATGFSGNTASAPYVPPINASDFTNIGYATTSIKVGAEYLHPLNNYDINYIGSKPLTFQVTYDANGGTGSYTSPDIIPGGTHTVLSASETGISREGYTFTGWNTAPDGGGVEYSPGDTITLTDNVTLYAQWIADPAFYTVTYGANGGNGGYTDPGMEFELSYIILSTSQTGISRKGFLFKGWNTRPDGSGTSYAPRDIIVITSDLGLYAQWMQIPEQQRLCRAPAMKCRTAIEGQKLWEDNDNAGNTRPPSVEILLLRDGEVYKRTNVASAGDGYFGFCCLPIWKNSSQKYIYQIDETDVPGYTKTIEGYNIINTFTP